MNVKAMQEVLETLIGYGDGAQQIEVPFQLIDAAKSALASRPKTNPGPVDWDKFHSTHKRLDTGLTLLETKTLTAIELAHVNALIAQLNDLSIQLYNHMEVARSRHATICKPQE